MAELAAGAVSSLLGVIRNEALLLGRVKGDVQFIKEEMESMNSFLAHLARTAPASGEHDEQVRTWMNQVRLLAQDCNNCIDLYLYRGNPDIHLARGGLQRYVWWLPWFVNKMFAQHRAAVQLRELKERARDVGERRMRYGVEVPAKAKAAGGLTAEAASAQETMAGGGDGEPAGDDAEEDEDGGDHQAVTRRHHRLSGSGSGCPSPGEALFGLHLVVEDYFSGKLVDWIKQVIGEGQKTIVPSVALVTSNPKVADTTANEAKAHYPQQRTVLVDIPAVHLPFVRLDPEDVLCYIHRELELELAKTQPQSQSQQDATSQSQQQEGTGRHHWGWTGRWGIHSERRNLLREIRGNIQEMKVYKRLEEIKSDISQVKLPQLQLDLEEQVDSKISEAPLPVLLLLLLRSAAAAAEEQGQARKKEVPTLAAFYEKIINEAAKKLKHDSEAEETAPGAKQSALIRLHDDAQAYQRILREVFPKTSDSKPLQAQEQNRTVTALGEHQIQEMIHKAKLEILGELKGTKSEAPDGQVQTPEADTQETTAKADIQEIRKKIDQVKQKTREMMSNKVIVGMIQNHLKDAKTLIILKINQYYALGGEEMRNALRLLGCITGVVVVTASENNQQAREYCHPPQEPMECSLVGLYHGIVLKLTRKQTNKEDNQILRGILDECNPHEFCMKIFAHALYANPKRSKEDLHKLSNTLQAVSPKSFGRIAAKMLKFSYTDLPKESKSCLLYLAIFPAGHKISRSTLIARWVAEGLITTEDWRWSSSARKARQCFDTLIDRWLIYPSDISATGEVKSCMVGDQVHQFITMIAEKERIVETRLSRHLARHFSISNDLRLRRSDTIHKFFENLSISSQLPLLKVLDLEGCNCFGEKTMNYLKDICCKILLLKYLSLRRTNVTQLPSEINSLHELEVLDIRQTKVPASATRNIRLLKLKRLLAGNIDASPSSTDTSTATKGEEFTSSHYVPEKIEKMLDMEVLTGFIAWNSQDLKDIRQLWQLRKLDVVIQDKNTHLKKLLRTIYDLGDCLQSLSITVIKGTPSRRGPSDDGITSGLRSTTSKVLQSLSIRGSTKKVQLVKLLTKDSKQLTKVTLANMLLSQDDMDVLSELPMLQCLRLRQTVYTETKLTFKKGEFQNLKCFVVEGFDMSDISFDDGATHDLEKIALPLSDDLKLCGVDRLPKLEELELNNNNRNSSNINSRSNLTTTITTAANTDSNSSSGDGNNNNMLFSLLDNAKHIAKVTLCGTLLKQADLQIIAKKPNIRCLVLLDKSYDESQLTFNKDEFLKLNILVVDCSNITKINFNDGSSPKLEKIVWTFPQMESLSGIGNLLKLKELELKGNFDLNEVKESIKKLKNKIYFIHYKPEIQDQEEVNRQEEEDVTKCSCFSNKN